jgi:serine/threonine-protein kinase
MVNEGSSVTLYVSRGESRVPNVVGMTGDAAESRLEDRGFDVSIDGPSDGTVTSQSPSGGSTAPSGSEVSITTQGADTGGGNGDEGNGGQGNGNEGNQPPEDGGIIPGP